MSETKAHPPHYLREWRKFRGLTLRTVAARLGVTHQHIGKVERFKTPLTDAVLLALRDVYRTDRGSLLDRNPFARDTLWSVIDRLPPVERDALATRLAQEYSQVG